MKAWLMDDYNGVENLRMVDDAPRPEPGEGQVLVKLHYAALNPADNYLTQKLYPARPSFPHVLGRDGCGVVEENGPRAGKFAEGTKVALLRGEAGVSKWGTLAQYVVVPEEILVSVPEGWTEKEAAAAPLVYLTAHQALNQWGVVTPGIVVLVTGMSGGVGVAALQLAKACGCKVVGTSRSAEKSEALRELGADLVLNPADEQFRKKVKEFCEGEGVSLAIDNIGGKFFDALLDVMGMWGQISVVGRLAGPVPEFNTAKLFFRRLRIGGVAVGTYAPAESQHAWDEIVSALENIEQKPLVDSVYSFEDVKEAFARLAEGPLGKVLIRTA